MTINLLALFVFCALSFGLGMAADAWLARHNAKPSPRLDNWYQRKLDRLASEILFLHAELARWQAWHDDHTRKCRLLYLSNEYEQKRNGQACEHERKQGGPNVT